MSRLTLAQQMRESVGVTIAVWFPESLSPDEMQAQTTRTLDDSELFSRPRNVVVVLDGCPQALEPVRRAAADLGARCGESPVVIEKELNEGQGGAVACGIEYLLAERNVPCIACRDGDGDHDVYDLPPMFRLLQTMTADAAAAYLPQGTQAGPAPEDNVYVIGARGSLHRPMGFARGEFEHILNRVQMTAINAHLAAQGRAIDERYCALQNDAPDFQSGYKLYTRETARIAAQSLRQAAAEKPEEAILRWGVQFVSTTQLLLSGAVPGAIHRLTYDEQPQSTFEGKHDYARAYGQQIAWLYERLGTPPLAGCAWIDAAIARSLYATAEGGWAELLGMREHVVSRVYHGAAVPPPPRRGEML